MMLATTNQWSTWHWFLKKKLKKRLHFVTHYIGAVTANSTHFHCVSIALKLGNIISVIGMIFNDLAGV